MLVAGRAGLARLALALWALVLTGCADTDSGRLRGDFLLVKSCAGSADMLFEPYEMNGDFFAVEQLGEIAFIRMQPSGKPLLRTDAFVLEVADSEFIRQRLGIAIPIDSPKVRASLHVLGSCPDATQAMTAHKGNVKFASYGTEKGDRVAATFQFQLFDDRTGEVVGLGFEGELDFTVKVGRPYQPFSRQEVD